jgi:hypothetical protein
VTVGHVVQWGWAANRARADSVTSAYVVPRHQLDTRLPLEPCQCTWRDSFISHANWTGVTQKGQIWKKVLVGFISRILIKKAKIKKMNPAWSTQSTRIAQFNIVGIGRKAPQLGQMSRVHIYR